MTVIMMYTALLFEMLAEKREDVRKGGVAISLVGAKNEAECGEITQRTKLKKLVPTLKV